MTVLIIGVFYKAGCIFVKKNTGLGVWFQKNLFQKSKIWSKIENLLKNQKFAQKSKICSKIKNLLKNQKFAQKSKICSEIENF